MGGFRKAFDRVGVKCLIIMKWVTLKQRGNVTPLSKTERNDLKSLLENATGEGDLRNEDGKLTGYRIDNQNEYSVNPTNFPSGHNYYEGEYRLFAVQNGSAYYASAALRNDYKIEELREGLIKSLESDPPQRYILLKE